MFDCLRQNHRTVYVYRFNWIVLVHIWHLTCSSWNSRVLRHSCITFCELILQHADSVIIAWLRNSSIIVSQSVLAIFLNVEWWYGVVEHIIRGHWYSNFRFFGDNTQCWCLTTHRYPLHFFTLVLHFNIIFWEFFYDWEQLLQPLLFLYFIRRQKVGR